MLYCQNVVSYNSIDLFLKYISNRLMTVQSSEIDGLNSLDDQAITAIHNRYYPDVYRFARFRVSDDCTAEDIAGEVFIRLLEAVHKGNGPTSNIRGWLISTTANVVNDYYRKIYNQPIEDPAEMHENSGDLFLNQDDPENITAQAEQHRIIRSAMEELTDSQKIVITLRFGNRLSLEETAKIMGKNANTIKALQYRALMTLRKIIGNEI